MEKVFEKAWKSAHVGFWVCQSQCTMLELCVTSTFWVMMVFLLVFHRKDLCEAKHEMQSVFKFSDVLFAHRSDEPPFKASSGREQY